MVVQGMADLAWLANSDADLASAPMLQMPSADMWWAVWADVDAFDEGESAELGRDWTSHAESGVSDLVAAEADGTDGIWWCGVDAGREGAADLETEKKNIW